MNDRAANLGGLKSLLEADKPGRPFNAPARENCDKLEWYPAVADLALSGDLGFTTGRWVCTLAGGGQSQGHYLTLWKRDAGSDWRVQFDATGSSPAPADAEPRLLTEGAASGPSAPPPQLVANEAVDQAIADFQDAIGHDGIAGGLRTYARTRDFLFYTNHAATLGMADANQYFTDHPMLGDCREESRILSADGTLAYCAGEFTNAKQRSGHAYSQIWQYEPRVANWGLRVLLIDSLSP